MLYPKEDKDTKILLYAVSLDFGASVTIVLCVDVRTITCQWKA